MPLKNIRFGHYRDEETIKRFIKDSIKYGKTEQESRELINKMYEITKKSIEVLYLKIDNYFEKIQMIPKLAESIKVNLGINLIADSLENDFINEEELNYIINEIKKYPIKD